MAKIKVIQSLYFQAQGPAIHYGYAGEGQVYAETVLGPLVVRVEGGTLPEVLEVLGKAIAGPLLQLGGLEAPETLETPETPTREKVLEGLRKFPALLGLPEHIVFPPGGITPEALADHLLDRTKANG